jgi:predicted DNA-binding protein (MmcQ/YjbR family)
VRLRRGLRLRRPGVAGGVSDPKRTYRTVVKFALGLPGAWEDHPWDEIVAKVGKKVFVFFGQPDSEYGPGMTVKLRESHGAALGVPGASPSGYGLGKAGWVDIKFGAKTPPVGVLTDWIEESYRLVAPKKMVADLDGRSQWAVKTRPAPGRSARRPR